MLLSCLLIIWTLCCDWMPAIARWGGEGIDSRCTPLHNGLTLSHEMSWNLFLIFLIGSKGFGVKLRSVTSLQLWSHTITMEVEVSWFGKGSPWLGKQNSTSASGLFYRDNVIEPSVPYACWHGNAFIFQDDYARLHHTHVVQDHLQFRRITTLQFNICRISFGDVSTDSLTSHRTSANSLMHSRRNGAIFSKQPLDEVAFSCVPGGEWWPYSLLSLLLTLYTDIYQTWSQVQVTWLIKNFVVDDICVQCHLNAIG